MRTANWFCDLFQSRFGWYTPLQMGVSSTYLLLKIRINYYLRNLARICACVHMHGSVYITNMHEPNLKVLVFTFQSNMLMMKQKIGGSVSRTFLTIWAIAFSVVVHSQLLYTVACACLITRARFQEQQARSAIKNETTKYLWVLLTLAGLLSVDSSLQTFPPWHSQALDSHSS